MFIQSQSTRKIMSRVLTGSLLFFSMLISGCAGSKSCNCETPRVCCRGLVPECAACEMGVDLEEWFNRTCPNGEKDAHYGGREEINKKSIWICDNSERQKIEISD